MIKKLLCLLVVLSVLLSLPACGIKEESHKDTSTHAKPSRKESAKETECVQTELADTTPTESPETQPTIPVIVETVPPETQPKPTDPAPTEPAPTEPTPTEPDPTEPLPPVVEQPTPTYGHTPLAATEYYQYSQMTAAEKKLYNKLVEGITQAKMEIPVTGTTIKAEAALVLFHRVLADHPEYFWVSRQSSVIYNTRTQIVEKYIILYTDGEKVDTMNGNTPVAVADRGKITAMWTALDQKIAEILGTIPANISQVDREKAIHDYMVNHVHYDNAAAGSANSSDAILPHAYDIYGAAVEGKAVCEGYAKLFQYLCYGTGINATQIVGTANGGAHMWNVVRLDGEWYEIDVTWDDTDDNIPNYAYFNLTQQEMAQSHITDTSRMPYPKATGTQYRYADYYALKALSSTQVSDNYQTVVQDLIAAGSGYLVLYKNGINLSGADYNTLVYNDTATIQKYARSLGYRLEFERTFFTSENFVYFAYTAKKI